MTSRIFVVANSYGDNASLKTATDFASTQNPDLVLHLGDFTILPYTPQEWNEYSATRNAARFVEATRAHTKETIEEAMDALTSPGAPVKVLPGENDPDLEALVGGADLHNKTTTLGDATIYGYGGSNAVGFTLAELRRLGELVTYDENAMHDAIIESKPDIVALHRPAFGLTDLNGASMHTGSLDALDAIGVAQPYLVLSSDTVEGGPLSRRAAFAHVAGGIEQMPHENGRGTYAANPGKVGHFIRFNEQGQVVLDEAPRTFMRVDVDEAGLPHEIVHYAFTGDAEHPVAVITETPIRYRNKRA